MLLWSLLLFGVGVVCFVLARVLISFVHVSFFLFYLVGLTSNSVLEVKVNTTELCLLITAHSGVLEAVASHPFKPFYVTAGREKMVRIFVGLQPMPLDVKRRMGSRVVCLVVLFVLLPPSTST